MSDAKVKLPPRQYKIIKVLAESGGRLSVDVLAGKLGKKVSDLMRDLEELASKKLVNVSRRKAYSIRVTNLGRKYLETGLPEEKLFEVIKSLGKEVPISELRSICGLENNEFAAAVGILRRFSVISVSGGVVKYTGNKDAEDRFMKHVRDLKIRLSSLMTPLIMGEVPNWVRDLRRRGFIVVEEVKEIYIDLPKEVLDLYSKGLIKEAIIITKLTPEIILSGLWRSAEFKEFDLSVDVPKVVPIRKHPYIQFLEYVRYVVTTMGFKEMKGPHIETELWNFDVLFVPQYHPSRRETDMYFIKTSASGKESEDVINRVKFIHESRLRYRWNPLRALRLILRTHTTPVSMRTIYEYGEGEYRAFSLDRVFRPDTPDPTHLMEFHQLEGIIVGKNVTFKHLLGFFKEFAKRLNLGEVLFKPAYFPFTEPSVEGYIKHPKLGWIEVFPGGMFRPEVLEAVGLKGYNVAAWGIGIDRIAMLVLGIDDIRHLYTNNLRVIRSMKVPYRVIG